MQMEYIFCSWQRFRWFWFIFFREELVSGLVFANCEFNFIQWAKQSFQCLSHHNIWFIFFIQKSHGRNEIFINRNKFHHSNFPLKKATPSVIDYKTVAYSGPCKIYYVSVWMIYRIMFETLWTRDGMPSTFIWTWILLVSTVFVG